MVWEEGIDQSRIFFLFFGFVLLFSLLFELLCYFLFWFYFLILMVMFVKSPLRVNSESWFIKPDSNRTDEGSVFFFVLFYFLW